ncbi:MAG: FkbM family methyltransferase [Verrucomicrobia bacterium]|nr:FkbM family methyltransferase [Verrucomicrobiota bacterium]
MSLIDRILTEPEFQSAPPVLVDVGAAGGVSHTWERIARYSIAVAFEPDARESAPLTGAQRKFKRWIYVPAVVTDSPSDSDTAVFYLTRSPQCSSTLRPCTDALQRWAFADLFDVIGQREIPATTLQSVLQSHGLPGLDWLKCDTQGTDFRLFMGLPAEIRRRVLAVEFEPGLIDAYESEDTFSQILGCMRSEPYLLAECVLQKTPLACAKWKHSQWYRRLAPTHPGWGNLRYLRTTGSPTETLDRRSMLLLWVLATLQGHFAHAHNVAEEGVDRFEGGIFLKMQKASLRQLRLAMAVRVPVWILQRLLLRG